MIEDPRLIQIRRYLERRPASALGRPAGTDEAAVSIVLRPREELELLLIKRAVYEGDPWSGHMALPGGRRGPEDESLLVTALRETREETSVAVPSEGALLGTLDEVKPHSPHLPSIVIAPFVVGVYPETDAQPDEREVEATIWVPLPALRRPDAVGEILVALEDGKRAFPTIHYGPYAIWGLTHRILMQFLNVVEEVGL